jgi:hypothetical protein
VATGVEQPASGLRIVGMAVCRVSLRLAQWLQSGCHDPSRPDSAHPSQGSCIGSSIHCSIKYVSWQGCDNNLHMTIGHRFAASLPAEDAQAAGLQHLLTRYGTRLVCTLSSCGQHCLCNGWNRAEPICVEVLYTACTYHTHVSGSSQWLHGQTRSWINFKLL